jgi:hypothetical protein
MKKVVFLVGFFLFLVDMSAQEGEMGFELVTPTSLNMVQLIELPLQYFE